MMDIERVRSYFPVTQRWVYMNHAGVSPLSTRVRDAMGGLLDDVVWNGATNARTWDRAVQETRRLVAGLIGAEPDEIAFVKNTTEGLSFVANGMDWREGDNAVTVSREFPANVYPWLALRGRGVETRFVEERDHRVELDDIAEAMDERTRVVSMSSVEFASGFRNDLDAVGELCAERGVLFVVDGIQSLGALRMDVRCSGVRALSADAHKWLLGPEGCGFFYCSKEALEQLQVHEMGWMSVVNASDYLHYDPTLKTDAGRFECGTRSIVGIYGLKAALELISEVGIGAIEARVLALTDVLCERLESRGYRVLSSRAEKERSGIVVFTGDRRDPRALCRILREQKIITVPRGAGVRVSPHYYNTEDELEEVVAALP